MNKIQHSDLGTYTRMSKPFTDLLRLVENKVKGAPSAIADFWDWHEMTPKAVVAGLIGTIAGGIGFLVYLDNRLKEPSNEFRSAKINAITAYADTNGDKICTRAEIDALYRDVIKDKNVMCISGQMPVYIDSGKEVSEREFTQWLRDYKPSK